MIVLIVIVILIGLRMKNSNCFDVNSKSKKHQKRSLHNDEDDDQIDNNKATLIPQIQTNTTTSTSSMVTNGLSYQNNGNVQCGSSTLYNQAKSVTISPPNQQFATIHRHQNQNQALNSSQLGLLTTVQNTSAVESLYTSIDAAQRQHLLGYGTGTKTLFTSYDPHSGTMNTMSSHGILQHDPMHDLRRLNSQMQQEQQKQQKQLQAGQQPTPTLVKIEDLSDYIDVLKYKQNEKFQIEYESIEPNQQFTWENSTKDYNRHKNRYANVIAYDHSRVVLAPLFDHHTHAILVGSDYINANFIDGYRKRNAYIATQGPLPSTYTDFWRMVWEQNTSIIVMMTKLEERNRLKCDQYWPNKGMENYGNLMQVSLVDTTELATYTIRTFILAHLGSNEQKREIKHFQYTAWPDHGVPEPATSFLGFLRRINSISMQQQESGSVVVHCSAGVGRTGCFIVVNSMLERAINEKAIDIFDYVTQIRAQRNYMVQTEDQYQFCYDAVLEVCPENTINLK